MIHDADLNINCALLSPRLNKANELPLGFYLFFPQRHYERFYGRSSFYGHAYDPLPEDGTGNLHGQTHRIEVIQQHPCIFQQHLLSTLPGEA
jgi:hypothetical protein